MIKFQGRSSLKQYMPLKPVKRGIKVWLLADSRNGYFSKFNVYTGKGATAEKGLGMRVVIAQAGGSNILHHNRLPRHPPAAARAGGEGAAQKNDGNQAGGED